MNSIFSTQTVPAQDLQIFYENENALFFDQDDASMRAVFHSYNVCRDLKLTSGLYISGPQVVIWLKDLNPINLVINTDETLISRGLSKEFVLTYCAMKSILMKLVAADCIEKSALTFQMRVRNSVGGPLAPIFLGNITNKIPFCARGTVSHTFAYLDNGYMSIFLNNNITDEKMQKIEAALADICPENNPLLQVHDRTQKLLK